MGTVERFWAQPAADGTGIEHSDKVAFEMAQQMELGLSRPARVLSVSELVRAVRTTLEQEIDECWVAGEVSNARLAPSGHLYLTLKDRLNALNVVMFRSAAARLKFQINDGLQVLAHGRVGLYEPRGALQFYADELQPRGLGALQLAFEQLKARLAAEGLFDSAHKRRLPFLPRTVAIVTALGGAALHDMLAIMLGRNPRVRVLIRGVRVQGNGAAAEIAAGLDELNREGSAEVIIAGRGGGSLEDLWAFNEETVARAIYRSRIPVVSAVGHEIDYTIADLVADVRAATPTAAAQLVMPLRSELKQRLAETASTLLGAERGVLANLRRHLGQLSRGIKSPQSSLRRERQRLDEAGEWLERALNRHLARRRELLFQLNERLHSPAQLAREQRAHAAHLRLHLARSLGARLAAHRVRLSGLMASLSAMRLRAGVETARRRGLELQSRLDESARQMLARRRARLAELAGRLDSLSPLRVLERGYAVVINRRDGRAVTAAAAVEVGDELEIRLQRGRLVALTRERKV